MKRRNNLSIDLPIEQDIRFNQNNQFSQTPKPSTPIANLLKTLEENLNELRSPNLKDYNSIDPFAETFKQAALNSHHLQINYDIQDVDKNESLNTPSIDLKCFEKSKRFSNQAPVSGLDILLSASQMCNNQNNHLLNNSIENGNLLNLIFLFLTHC